MSNALILFIEGALSEKNAHPKKMTQHLQKKHYYIATAPCLDSKIADRIAHRKNYFEVTRLRHCNRRNFSVDLEYYRKMLHNFTKRWCQNQAFDTLESYEHSLYGYVFYRILNKILLIF